MIVGLLRHWDPTLGCELRYTVAMLLLASYSTGLGIKVL